LEFGLQSILGLAEACEFQRMVVPHPSLSHLRTGLVSGTVAYRPDPIDPSSAGNVPICCSKPQGDVSITKPERRPGGWLLLGSWRLRFEVSDQATTTHSESNPWIFQRNNRSRRENTQSGNRPKAHALARLRRDHFDRGTINKLPNQSYVSRVYEEENRAMRNGQPFLSEA